MHRQIEPGPGGRSPARRVALVALATAPLFAGVAGAQELEPRAYSLSPVGLSFVLGGYQKSDGEFVFDAASPLSDVTADIDFGTVAVGHVFDLAGRQANLSLAVPYAYGDLEGNVQEDRRSVHRSGIADVRLRGSVLLWNGSAVDRATFVKREPAPVVGVSLTVVAPVGQYDPAKLVNIGTNRWAVKPEVGYTHPLGAWQVELYGGVWVFGDNDEFYGGRRKEQDPIATFQGHLVYTFRPNLWIAANLTHYSGGRTTLDGVQQADLQKNVRVGVTGAVPLGHGHTLKISWSRGAITRIGGDFASYGLAWQYAWLD